MKGKISEMMNHLDPKHLENIELGDQEIEELTAALDIAHMEQLAEEKRRKLKEGEKAFTTAIKKGGNFKYLFVAVICALCLATTAFASQTGYFDLLFGRSSNVPEEKIIKVAESIEKDGIIMTLEEILPGSDGGILILTFERKDGQPFPNSTTLAGFQLILLDDEGREEDTKFFSQNEKYLQTEDNRRVICHYTLSEGQSLLDRQMRIEIGTLYTSDYQELSMGLNLGEYFLENPDNTMTAGLVSEVREQVKAAMEEDVTFDRSIRIVEEQPLEGALEALATDIHWVSRKLQDSAEQSPQPALPLESLRPDLTLKGMILVDDILCAAINSESKEKYSNIELHSDAGIEALLDTRTGEEIYFSAAANDVYMFTGIKEKDLPYLVPVVSYSLKDIVSEAEWSFTCFLEDRQQIKDVPLVADMETEQGTYRIQKVIISPIEIRFSGYWLEPAERGGVPIDRPAVALLLGDGSKIEMYDLGGYYENGMFEFSYMLIQDNSEEVMRRFLDRSITDNLDKILINGQAYDLTE